MRLKSIGVSGCLVLLLFVIPTGTAFAEGLFRVGPVDPQHGFPSGTRIRRALRSNSAHPRMRLNWTGVPRSLLTPAVFRRFLLTTGQLNISTT